MDVVGCGRLRPGRNGCGSGKWVAGTEAGARQWGAALDDRFPARVVVLEWDDEIVERAHFVDNPDRIGPAAYIQGDDLPQVHIVEVIGYGS